MAHSHDGHSQGPGHHHGTNNKKALGIAFFLITIYMVIEVIGGFITNSLALISDAGHMLSDSVALGVSFFALKLGEKQPTNDKTFGFKRFEILAAFLNGIALIVISIYILWESYKRFLNPPEVMSSGMLIISIIGLLVNIAAAFILMKGDTSENLNVRSAFLHVMGDLLGSVGAIVAALLILFFNWGIADPIASVIVSILIIISGWRVTKDSFHILMEGTPSNIDLSALKKSLLSLDEVKSVHDLHIWSITSDFPALSCHIVVNGQVSYESVLSKAKRILHDEFHIEHTTIQVDKERSKYDEHDHCN